MEGRYQAIWAWLIYRMEQDCAVDIMGDTRASGHAVYLLGRCMWVMLFKVYARVVSIVDNLPEGMFLLIPPPSSDVLWCGIFEGPAHIWVCLRVGHASPVTDPFHYGGLWIPVQ